MKRLIAIALALAASVAFGATTLPVQLLNPTGSSSGQTIVSSGASSAPAWGGVGLSGIAAIGANTLIGNATSGSATPTAVTVTGCNGAAQALQWTNGSGFGCNSAVATSGANTNITSLAAGTTLNTPNITGVTSGSLPSAGSVGEYVCAQVTNGGSPTGCQTNSATPVSLTTNTAANVASLSLTSGFWQICGNIYFSPNASTVVTQLVGQIAQTSATLGAPPNFGSGFLWGGSVTGLAMAQPVGCRVLWFSSTTTVYLVAQSSFTTNTNSAYGFIWALRFH